MTAHKEHSKHDHHHHHGHHHHSEGNIAVAFWLNTGFAVIELIGGFYTNSVAILSDALHDFGDSLSLGSAWFFERKAGRDPDKTYTYGYGRFSLVGALINAVVLLSGSVFILVEAVKRFLSPVQPETTGMILLAILGIAVNGAALLRLRKGTSISEKIISLHFIEDVVGWVAVLLGSVVMKFTSAPWLDPVLSVIIASMIIVNVYKNMRSAFQIILQGVPLNVSEEAVRKVIATFPQVDAVHDIHLWTLDGTFNILTLHIVVKEPYSLESLEALKKDIKSRLKQIDVDHATIEFELKGTDCAEC